MTAFPIAAIRATRLTANLDGRFWPKAAVQIELEEQILSVRFGVQSGHSDITQDHNV